MKWNEFVKKANSYPKRLKAESLEDSVRKVKEVISGDLIDVEDAEITRAMSMTRLDLENKLELEVFQPFSEIAEEYSAGNIMKAMTQMKDKILPEPPDNPLLEVSEKNDKSTFYRIRSSNDKYQIFDKKGMFHISMKSRNVIANQRYSINGFPCLYLGTSLYDCWEETRRPDFERMNYTAFEYSRSRPLRLLTIDLCKQIKSIDDFCRLVLFLLCTFIVNDDSKSYKFEYVMPELVLHSLISYNRTHAEKDQYDGIIYLSSRFFSSDCIFPNDHDRMLNLVLPVRKETSGGLCEILKKMFRISETGALFTERIFGGTLTASKPRATTYSRSLFSMIESEIKKRKLEFLR